MKIKAIILLTTMIILTCCAAKGESAAGTSVTCGEDWTWDPGASNTFDGETDVSGYTGTELTIRMETDLPYTDEEQDAKPVFTIVNGSRITVLKQSDTARCTPESQTLSFSGRMTLPAKQHVRQITFRFILSDENGQELKTSSFTLGSGEETGGAFYIAADIRMITLGIGAAAAAVWAAAIARNRLVRKKQRTGD